MVTMGAETRGEDPKGSEPLKAPEPGPSPLSRLGGLARLCACRRRKSKEEEADAAQARYEQLLKIGSAVDQRKREDWYDRLAWWTDVKTKSGARVFVLAPRGPRGETEYGINMHELLAYALSKMHRVVAEEDTRFAVVWVQLSDHRVGPWQCFRFAESLHERYAANLEAIHVVHPSWTTRILRLVLWPLASEEFWDYFHSHERIEFLDVALDMRKFRLPKDIMEYDKWLDQQAAELHKQQAMKQGAMMSGSFGSMASGMDEERKKMDQQMEDMKRILEQKGYGSSGKQD
ncbi:unnamed protein product [Symbiodinium sp. CCMP2592]|nr:unnamed protein product [Symbiodinium sp. CCMP2592]